MPAPLLHGDGTTFGWDDWPWVAAFLLALGCFWVLMEWLRRRARR